MASYHLSVKSVSRSGGRSATAAAAYRAAERIDCKREGRTHDYTRKSGVEHGEIVAPEGAPVWVRDRAALWNGAEAAENRKNSVVAREWELALPSELDAAGRRELALDFAHELVARYGVVADVCIHAPHREGDQRNHHAHVMTTTREVGAEGFGAKTRILDVKQTASIEVSAMRELWAERQNAALERVGTPERVDHRTLEAQRETAEAERDRLAAALEERHAQREAEAEAERDQDWQETERQLAVKALEAAALDRPAEVKLGPKASSMERRAERRAEAEGRPYEPVTDIGAQVHELREQRSLFDAAIDRLERAGGSVVRHLRETVSWVRDTVLGERDPARGPEGWSEVRGQDGGRVEGSRSGEAPATSDRRQALLDRLRAIGGGGASGRDAADGRETVEDKPNEQLGRFAADRYGLTVAPPSAEGVQEHMRRIEEQNRAETQEKRLRETRARDNRGLAGQDRAPPPASTPSAEDVKAHIRQIEQQNRAAEKEQRERTAKEIRDRDGPDRGRGRSR